MEAHVRRRSRRSWVDLLTAAIERLPGPAWAAYLVVLVALVLAANAAAWAEGQLPAGSFDLYLTSLAIYPITALGAVHYLDIQAAAALDRMRLVVTADDAAFAAVRRELTTMPPGPTIAWSMIGLAFAAGYIAFGQAVPVRDSGPIVRAFDGAMALIGFPLLAVLFFHTIRQLRTISHIHASIARIDLFQLEPLHAFAGVTARSGLIILGLAYVSAATDPSTFVLDNPTLFAFLIVSIVVAIAAFLLPLMAMHRRLANAKSELLTEASADLRTLLDEVGRRTRASDLSEADALNKQLDSLVTRRDVIVRIPTWPWQAGTLRGFATAVVLPILLWLVFRALERLLS